MSNKLQEDIDFYINDEGNFVFTSHYLRKRGYCCKNRCTNCPYTDWENLGDQHKKKPKSNE